jgi:hypothetical protein
MEAIMSRTTLAALVLAVAIPVANAQADGSSLRERAIASCKANRGTDCASAEGLKEWIDAERPRAPGQRSAIQMQKLEAERKAQREKAAHPSK